MGLREKVALRIVAIAIIQITFAFCSSTRKTQEIFSNIRNHKRNLDAATEPPMVIPLRPYVQGSQSRNKELIDTNQERIRKTFNFPDVEYPTASTPRPPFYLQETNILQRNPVQRAAELPSSTTAQYPLNDIKKSKKYNNKNSAKLTSPNSLGITISFPEFATTPKPYCFREEGAFPEVEYPLSARDLWKPNYWKQIANGGSNSEINNNRPNGLPSFAKPITSKGSVKGPKMFDTNQKPMSSKVNNSNNLNTTPVPPLTSSTSTTTPFVLTPYTTVYFSTTPSYTDTRIEDNENRSPDVKKSRKKKKGKKKSTKTDISSPLTDIVISRDENNGELTQSITTPLPNDLFLINSTQENLFNIVPDVYISAGNMDKSDTCSNIFNDTMPLMYVVTTTPPYYLSGDDDASVSSLTIHNDDATLKVRCDKNIASIFDAANAIESENRDNEESYFVESVTNTNKSSACADNINILALFTREDDLPSNNNEFTTDVFPDFDENISPIVNASTSTLSPINFANVDKAWVNSDVIDYKSMLYPDELEQYYIVIP